ncbi:MAG: AAA-associated domain-containing protein [Nitrososphaerales archaeon]
MEKAAEGASAVSRDAVSSIPPIMPANVRAGQVIGLVEITGGLGSKIDVAKLADEFGADLQTLLPILDTGEMLGLVRIEKGDVSLTEFGLKFQKTSKHKVRLLRDQLSKIEPFKTALELVGSKNGEASTSDICKSLAQRDIRWHHYPELNDALVQALLIHWAIYAGLLTYNGKTGKFQKI